MPLISSAAILLEAVARAGSIRAAAARQNISPSALNRQILNLEHEYGELLFERLPRGVRLTAAGQVLVADIRRWMREHERSRRHLDELRGAIKGHVSLGIMESLAVHMVSRLVTAMRDRPSHISLDVRVGGTEMLIERLRKGDVDLAVCYAPPGLPDLTLVRQIEPRPGIMVGKDHPLASRKSVRLSDCTEYTFVLPDASLSLREKIDRSLAKLRFLPRHVVTTNSIGVMRMLVRDHGHIAMLGLADVHLESDGLVHIPFSDHVHSGSPLALVAARHVRMAPATSIVADHLGDMLGELPGAVAADRRGDVPDAGGA